MVVMVTHGIDEAILLSDKIVVMSNPPGPSIVDIIDVETPACVIAFRWPTARNTRRCRHG